MAKAWKHWKTELAKPGEQVEGVEFLPGEDVHFQPGAEMLLTKQVAVLGGAPSSLGVSVTAKTRAFWKLDEASGADRVDYVGTSTLTDIGTPVQPVAQIGGQIGNAANYPNYNALRYLQVASNSHVSANNASFEIAGWIYLRDVTINHQGIWGKSKSTSSLGDDNFEYIVFFNFAVGRIRFLVRNAGLSYVIDCDALGLPTINTWYFVDAWCVKGTSVNIQINGGTINTAAHAGNMIQDASIPFNVGIDGVYGLNGICDALGIYDLLTTAEQAYLYNSGTGREPPFA